MTRVYILKLIDRYQGMLDDSMIALSKSYATDDDDHFWDPDAEYWKPWKKRKSEDEVALRHIHRALNTAWQGFERAKKEITGNKP